MTVRPLTAQQRRVLRFVQGFYQEQGFPPTFREIGDGVGLDNINAVRGHLSALEKKGYIRRTPEKARSIRIVGAPSAFSEFKRRLHQLLRTDEGVVYRVAYGLAWTTWRRRPYFTGARAGRLRQALEREAVEHGWTLVDKKVEPDHVVVVVEVWPNHSPELAVRRFQAAGRALKRRHPGGFESGRLWGKGYAATTDLELMEELVSRLLEGQPSESA